MAGTEPSWRQDLVGDLEGDVLEIGAGTGGNFTYYRRARQVSAIEPDAERAGEARRAAAHAHVPIKVDISPAESLPYPDNSFDHAVSSLVFCSVAKPIAALREIARVLRPGGTLHMVEHVQPENWVFGPIFSLATPAWKRVANGCHLNRRTIHTLRAEGWQVEELGRKWLIFARLRAQPPVR